MGALCDRLIDHPRARGVWAALQAMARLAHLGCHADDLRVTAFNGRLFAPARTPLAERGQRRGSGGRRGRAGPRHLSHDARPAPHRLPRSRRRAARARSTSGCWSTSPFANRRPDAGAPADVGRAEDDRQLLHAARDDRLPGAADAGSAGRGTVRRRHPGAAGARSGDGERRLPGGGVSLSSPNGSSRRAWRKARGSTARSPRPTARELARTVAERCLYGIDRNPTAVQLARLSLWLVTLSADRPLTFLDHHLVAGNSLVGARLADLGAPPARAASGDDRQRSLFDDEARQAWGRRVVPERTRLAHGSRRTRPRTSGPRNAVSSGCRRPTDPRIAGSGPRISGAASGCSATACRPGLYDDLQRHAAGRPTALPGRELGPKVDEAVAAARGHDALHWELVFPEVFLDDSGMPRDDAGFDAVIGNPPWDVLRGDTGDARQRAGGRDEAGAMLRFIRATPYYRLHAAGHVNQYQLFVERALSALGSRGRLGLILPSGLQSDVGSGGLRRALFDRCRLDTWIAFDNRRAIFPIHRSMRFVLIAGTHGQRTEVLASTDGGSDAATLARLPDDPRSGDGSLPRRHAVARLPRAVGSGAPHRPSPAGPESLAIADKALGAAGCERCRRVGRDLRTGAERDRRPRSSHQGPSPARRRAAAGRPGQAPAAVCGGRRGGRRPSSRGPTRGPCSGPAGRTRASLSRRGLGDESA